MCVTPFLHCADDTSHFINALQGDCYFNLIWFLARDRGPQNGLTSLDYQIPTQVGEIKIASGLQSLLVLTANQPSRFRVGHAVRRGVEKRPLR
jgi:hypothetical protein